MITWNSLIKHAFPSHPSGFLEQVDLTFILDVESTFKGHDPYKKVDYHCICDRRVQSLSTPDYLLSTSASYLLDTQ